MMRSPVPLLYYQLYHYREKSEKNQFMTILADMVKCIYSMVVFLYPTVVEIDIATQVCRARFCAYSSGEAERRTEPQLVCGEYGSSDAELV